MEVGLSFGGFLNPKIEDKLTGNPGMKNPKSPRQPNFAREKYSGSGIFDPWIIPEDLVRKLSSQNAQMRISRISKRERYTLPETNSSHLKHWGWKMSFLLGRPS